MLKNLINFSLKFFFLIKVYLKITKQSIYSFIDIFLSIINLKMVIKLLLPITNLKKLNLKYNSLLFIEIRILYLQLFKYYY